LEAGAERWRRVVGIGALAMLVTACLLGVSSFLPPLMGWIGTGTSKVVLVWAGAFLIAAAGLSTTTLILQGRSGGERLASRLAWFGGWPQAALSGVLAEVAIVAAFFVCWTSNSSGAGLGAVLASPPLVAGVVAALGFPLLVFERHLAAAGPEFPEAAALARLLRLPLTALIGGGLLLGAVGAGFSSDSRLISAGVEGLAGLVGVVALEALLRALARLFAPPARAQEVRALANSTLVTLILGGCRRGPSRLGASLVDRFGVDLSRSWALGFIRRAMLPLTLVLGLVAWGITSLTALHPDQRGIYEQFGAPVAVFGPGLSIHWPWPLGIVRPTEYGTVHEMTVTLPTPGETAKTPPIRETADGPAPAEANRLWIEAHPSEVSYLVPGVASENGEDAFELVDLDLRLLYRIGMTDQAAIAARASLSDPEALIRAYAGAWLVRTLSTRTLPALLREDTRRLQQDMAVALQHDLDQANSGLELLGVLIDAIHPPPGAAGAYHGVQAAEIRAAAELAKERRAAVTLTGEAREKAAMTLNLAAAHAQEMRANAAIERIRFLTEVQAQHDAGDGLGLDRRLHSLERSLAGGTLTILDRRIALQSGTTLDFRPASANSAAASDAADADIPVGETPSSSSPASDAPEAPGSTNPPNSVNPEDGP
jgi:regulator of protease activity HflC (stomatin/prohibitin superfamily)